MEKLRKFRKPIIITLGVILAFILVLIIVKHKGKKEEHVINPMFAEYVSALTTGVISCEATIKVVLVEPYKGDSAKRDELIKNIFDFSPNIKGVARWLDHRTIEFVPEKKLSSGEQYEVKFKLFKLVNVPDELRILTFTFVVIKQDFTVSETGLHTYAGIADRYYLQGSVVTADAIQNDVIEKVLTARVSGKKMPIRWEHSADRKEYTYTVDSIHRTSQAQLLTISWDGKAAAIEQTGKTDLEIPIIGVFKVIDVRQEYSPEKYFKIIFSDPLLQSQNLDGLITLDNISDLRFTIEDNTVKVYYEKAGENTSFRLIVNTGVQNYKGDPLPEKYIKQMRSEEIKPAVEIIGKGVIMPNSGDIILPFRAVSLKSVDVTVVKIFENNIPQFLQVNNLSGVRELKRVGRPVYRGKIDLVSDHVLDLSVWNTFSVDLNKFVKDDPGALYRVTFSFKKAYSIYPCLKDTTAKSSSDAEEINSGQNDQDFSDWDVSDNGYYDEGYYYYEQDYYDEGNYWQNRDNPCYKAYYNSDRFPSCNLLASNLGITAKVNKNNELNIVVTDINSAEPISGVSLDIIDYQQQVMASTSTNSNGFASIKTNHRPYLVIAKNGKERGYLPLTGSSTLSLSTFDVGGDEVQKGLKGFIYGERGVWRPGDTLFLGFILEDKNKTLPPNHPVIFEMTDPNGRLFKRLVKSSSVNGFFTFNIVTDEKSPTGNWDVKIKAGGAVFNKVVKIETIKPNRLEINLDVLGNKTFAENKLKGKLSVKWLTGAIASNLKARISCNIRYFYYFV